MIGEVITQHVYKKIDDVDGELTNEKFSLYQYVYNLYVLSEVGNPKDKFIKLPTEDKKVDVFKHYNELLHQIIETDNVIVSIPDIHNIPEVLFFEIDMIDDGFAYMANVELELNSKEDSFFKDGNDLFINYKRMGKYDD